MLTEEQSKMVEENHNLIYKFISMHHLEESEYYGDLAIVLCKAVTHYNPNNNTRFSTYAFQCFENVLHEISRFNNTKKRIKQSQLTYFSNFTYNGDDGEIEIEFPDPKNCYDEVLQNEEYEEFANQFLTPIQKQVFKLLMKGYTQRDIADIRHTSNQNISDMTIRIMSKWKKYKENRDESIRK